MRNILRIMLSSILSGIIVSIGGIVFVYSKGSFENGAIIGSFLFSFALLLIIEYQLDLFTGKVCYFFHKENIYKLNLIFILLGNIIGAVLIGYFIRLTNNDLVNTTIFQIVNAKMSISLFSAFIMAFFCGIMIFFGVDIAKRSSNKLFSSLITILCIMIFILSGFEHSIANTFYYSLANIWNLKTIVYLLVIISGNFVGGIFFPLIFSLMGRLNTKEVAK
ncbi:MAG TPA: formate/nitrite transporter family protein [Acholeplasmataceae bacterium]|nr:formate/nitrite transporter family protein [Acholeplasmataceae bacterium]